MNPYDFVPIDTQQPQRREPVWHHVLKGANTDAGKLYSGHLYVDITAETPLFIPNTNTFTLNLEEYPYPKFPKEHIRNNDEQYIIPGTSLKGLLRSVVETLCNGCMRVFHFPKGYARDSIPDGFHACGNHKDLCIACRLFGMMSENQRNAQVFLGKVNMGDALAYPEKLELHESIYTAILEGPKPHHTAFYLDPARRYIAGRKFYFHHHGRLNTVDDLIEIPGKPQGTNDRSEKYRNQYIRPLATGTAFDARIDFTNLEADEFAALLLAITLTWDMRHKIGYGKPIGLGSVRMDITELTLVDYAKRYTAFRTDRGKRTYDFDEVAKLVEDQMASLDEKLSAAWKRFDQQPALDHLYRIWAWQPGSMVVYSYPSRDWFNTHSQARIEDTYDLYPGE